MFNNLSIMEIINTSIDQVFLLKFKKKQDLRGHFFRIYENTSLKKFKLKYQGIAYNKKKGTIRGLHTQLNPYSEQKIITCIKGSIIDVIIDLRKNSKTYLKILKFKLIDKQTNSLYIPKGFMHGYQTLENNTTVLYSIDGKYNKNAEFGIRWNDPYFKIKWPLPVSNINRKDKAYKDFIYEE